MNIFPQHWIKALSQWFTLIFHLNTRSSLSLKQKPLMVQPWVGKWWPISSFFFTPHFPSNHHVLVSKQFTAFCLFFLRKPHSPLVPPPSITSAYLFHRNATWNQQECSPKAFSSSFSLICFSCVTTSICLSLLAFVCDNNSVILSSEEWWWWWWWWGTLLWHLSSAPGWLTAFWAVYHRQNCPSSIQK